MKPLELLAVTALVAAAAYGIPWKHGQVSNTGTSKAGCLGTIWLSAGCTLLPDGTAPDPNYHLTSVPSGSSNQTIAVATFARGLLANNTSRWISPNNAGNTDPAGNYTYTQTFTLGSVNPLDYLTGRWSSDNAAKLSLNGIEYAQRAGNVANVWTPFTIGSGFQSGLNTLTFTVNNTLASGGAQTPSGLRVEFGTVFVPEAYETTTVSVMLGGLLLWGLKRRKPKAGA